MPLKSHSGELMNKDVKRVPDDDIQKHLGAMNMKNPMKPTTNTMLSNPTRVAAYYLFGKDFDDCNGQEK